MTDDESTPTVPDPDGEDGAADGDPAEVPVVAPPGGAADEHPSDGHQLRGDVTGVETVDAAVIPAAYPVDISTDQVVAVELSIGGPDDQRVVVYFGSPVTGVDARLARLLRLADVGPEDVAQLEDETILLAVEEGHYLPVIPDEPPRGTPRAVYGVVLGLLPSVVIAFTGIFSPGSSLVGSTSFVLAWLVGTFLLLPASLYVDGIHLRSTTNWDGTPRTWAILAAIPAFNVLVVPLYLISREKAEPLA